MKHLTEEQKKILHDAVENFLGIVAFGAEGEDLDRAIQQELVKPFIEPLINGKI